MTNNYEAIALASSTEVLDDKNEFMFKVLNEANRWTESEVELAQGRSDFQIEKFIIHDSFTIPSAFKSALINRKSVAESLLSKIIDAKKEAREIVKLQVSDVGVISVDSNELVLSLAGQKQIDALSRLTKK